MTLGSIPCSRDAICAINELAKLGNEDLDKLYDVMEERGFNFEKYGIKKFISTPTSIIASANPANKDTWINNEKIDFNELPFLAPLKDRFDLILILQQKKDPKERDNFADQLAEVESKKEKGELPDYTEFIIKYIQYAKQINPVLTDEAWYMLKEFYKKVNAKGFGSPRVLKTLKKIAKAIARLKLKNVVDEKDVQEVMEYYNAMLVKFQKHVVPSESIKMIAYKKGVEIIKQFENFGGITIEALFTTMCKQNKQLATYFGYDIEKSLKMQDNRKVSDVKKLLLENTHIKRVQDNPIVLKWFGQPQSDEPDKPDRENYPTQEKNNNNNFFISQEFLRFGKDNLSKGKADKNNYPSFKSCQIRIPGSINAKYGAKVKIVQKWNEVRPSITREFLEDFRTYLEQKVTDQEHNNKYNNNYNNSRSISIQNPTTSYYEWIDKKILANPFPDCRKLIVDLVLAPYLINIKKLSNGKSYQIIKEWLDKCNSLERLDNYRNFVNYRIHFALKNAIHKGIGQMSQEKIKKDKYKKLYTLLFKDK